MHNLFQTVSGAGVEGGRTPSAGIRSAQAWFAGGERIGYPRWASARRGRRPDRIRRRAVRIRRANAQNGWRTRDEACRRATLDAGEMARTMDNAEPC